MRVITLFLLCIASWFASAAEPWQTWRVEASNNPQQWLTTTEQWITDYDAQRRYSELALAYAIRAEAFRYLGEESKARDAISEGLRFAHIADDPTSTSLLYINEGWYFLQRGMLTKATDSTRNAIAAAQTADNANLLVESQILQSQVFYDSGDITRALQILESLEQQQYTDIPRLAMEYHSLVGTIYLEVGASNIAVEHMRNAYEISQQSLGDWDISVTQYNYGRALFNEGQLEQSEQQFRQALAISQQLDDKLGIAYGLFRLAQIEASNDNLSIGLELYRRALPEFTDAGSHPMEAQTRLAISQLLFDLGHFKALPEELGAARSIISTLNNPQLNQELYELWSNYHQQMGNYQQALVDYKISVNYLLEHQQSVQDKQVQEIMVRLEIREQESTNKLLQQENQLQQLQIQEQRTSNYLMLWLLSSGAVIVLLISYFLYQQMRARQQYKELALKDDLTGAPNRRAIVRYCKELLAQKRSSNQRIAIALIDFDYFKLINDQFGHDVGDHVLCRFAQVTESCLRSNDKYGRMGGEEWLLALFNTSEQDAHLIFERLLDGLNQQPIDGLPQDYSLTFSMGFAVSSHGEDFDDLYKRADDALYQAKDLGRRQLQVAALPADSDD